MDMESRLSALGHKIVEIFLPKSGESKVQKVGIAALKTSNQPSSVSLAHRKIAPMHEKSGLCREIKQMQRELPYEVSRLVPEYVEQRSLPELKAIKGSLALAQELLHKPTSEKEIEKMRKGVVDDLLVHLSNNSKRVTLLVKWMEKLGYKEGDLHLSNIREVRYALEDLHDRVTKNGQDIDQFAKSVASLQRSYPHLAKTLTDHGVVIRSQVMDDKKFQKGWKSLQEKFARESTDKKWTEAERHELKDLGLNLQTQYDPFMIAAQWVISRMAMPTKALIQCVGLKHENIVGLLQAYRQMLLATEIANEKLR